MEADNAERFRKNFADKPWIKVPEVDRALTTEQILTMEYCPGTKINRAAELDKLGIDRKRLARLAVESYLQQLLTYGFFHADVSCCPAMLIMQPACQQPLFAVPFPAHSLSHVNAGPSGS